MIHGCPQFFYFPRRKRSGICLGMILYASSAHALKDEMKADSICVLFMSEKGDRIGAETGKRGMEGFSGSVSLHGSCFRRILVRSVFLWDLYTFHGVRLSLSCSYGGIHFRRFAGVRRSGNAYEPICPAGCLCYGADGAVPSFVLRYFHAQEI